MNRRPNKIFVRGLMAAFLTSLLILTTQVPSGGFSGAGGTRMRYGTVNGGRILPIAQAREKARRMVRRQTRRMMSGGRVRVTLRTFRKYTFWGEATTYSTATNGTATACGRPLRDGDLTAAHRTLPCGSKVLVQNPANGNRVKVTITDRGPYGDSGRVIDLSSAAWRRVTNRPPGVAHVHAIVLRRG
ncbi:MAG TPA: septal ring lytic transglycosylase RlpA family protein [Actinomycetota bacterium]|nr:septal ring lytic transglycosylase RlpA family protein [Actinomycetota bacterium]